MSSRTVQGKLARVSGKPFNDQKTGEPITLYSFQLEGSNQWFRTGQAPIPAGVGQDVKFVANGANVERGTLVTVASTVAQAPPVSTSVASASQSQGSPVQSAEASSPRGSARTANGNKDDYWAAKEARDLEKDARFQEVSEPRMALSVAVEAAATLVATAITKDAISFGNAAKAKKLGMLSAYTKEVALELAAFIHDAPNQLAAFKNGGNANAGNEDAGVEVQE